MSEQQRINTAELNKVAALVEDHCTTSETTTSQAVERILLELAVANATVKLLKHQLDAHENATGA